MYNVHQSKDVWYFLLLPFVQYGKWFLSNKNQVLRSSYICWGSFGSFNFRLCNVEVILGEKKSLTLQTQKSENLALLFDQFAYECFEFDS